MGKNTAEIRVGRLLEIRVRKGYETVGDVDAMIAMIRTATSSLPAHVKHVTVADWRACRVMLPAASARALEMLISTNPRTERAGVLISRDSPTAVMQFFRLVSDAENPGRKVFFDAGELVSWLAEVLTPEETESLRAFMAAPLT